MDSIPKRPKRPQEASIEEQTLDDDFISNLPDSIICHILSKLPTKHAVATTILSTRWKNLFALIPNLNLNFNDSLILHPVDEANPNPVDRTASFISFVYRVLNVILHDVSHINQFGLNCDQDYDDTHIIAWICAALRRKVSFLDLEITMKSPILLLDNLCGCTTLKHLTLGKHLVLDVPSSFCLPNLKYLWLENVEFLGESSVPDLLSGCPVLEDLFMFNCDLNVIFLNISIPSLKGLIIENCFDEEVGYDMVLDTPALEMLMYTDFVADKYWVMNMGSVLKVHIDVGPTEEQLEEDSVRYNQNVAALVTASSTVDSLFLSKVSITAFHRSCRPMPLFRNLIHLMLGGFGIDGWDLLPLLLESAPNLEFLDITEGFYDENGCYARFESRLSESVAACLSLHLKKIDIREFKGEEDEFKLVEYFLKSAKVLNKLKIHSDLSMPMIFCIQKKVLMLPKLSETCQILLYKSD